MRCAAATLALASIAAAIPSWSADAGHEPGSVFRDCDDCPEMVVVPAGSFVMGTPGVSRARGAAAAEGDVTVVTIPAAFALGRREVTRGEYARFIADSGHEPQAGCRVWDATLERFSEDPRRGWQDAGPGDDGPATCVSFADATAYVQWLAAKTGARYRLPSEAEWEYAARAGSRSLRPWGDAAEDGCDAANTYDLVAAARFRLGWPEARCRDGFADLAPAGQLAANAFGVHDMAGNVWEWVSDWASLYPDEPVSDPAGRPSGTLRLVRGGSYGDDPSNLRVSNRTPNAPDRVNLNVGFRCARDSR